MAPFVYQPYHNPYVNTISELMQRQGEIPAQAAERVAALQADAMRQTATLNANAKVASAQAYGGALSNFGAGVSGAIAQATDPRRQLEALQSQELQGRLQDQQALRSAKSRLANTLADHPLGVGQEGPQADTYMTADGLNDIPKQAQWINSVGLAPYASELIKGQEDINTYVLNARDHEQKAADAKAIMQGYMANAALKLNQIVGMPINAAIDWAAKPGLNQKQITPQELQQFQAQIAALPPNQQIAALQQVKQHAADIGAKKEHGKDTTETNIFGEQTYANTVPPEAPASQDVKGYVQGMEGPQTVSYFPSRDKNTPARHMMMVNGQWQDVSGRFTPYEEAAASEQKQGLIKGIPGEHTVSYFPSRDPTKTAKVMYTDDNGQNIDVTGRFVPKIPPSIILRDQQNQPINLPNWALNYQTNFGDQGNVFDQELRMTPNGLAQDALTKIATGNYSGIAGRGGDRFSQIRRAAVDSKSAAIVAASGMDEPALRSFLQSNMKSLTEQMKQSDTVSASLAKADLDTEQFKEALKKMPDLGQPILNKPWREFENAVLGNQDLAEIRTRLMTVRKEYNRLTTGGTTLNMQMTDASQKEMGHLIDDNATVGQIIRSVNALHDEGDNRLLSLDQQIKAIQNRMKIPVTSGGGANGVLPYTVIKKK